MTEPLATTSGPMTSADTIDQPQNTRSTRPCYERPRITFQQPLEVMASVCNPPGKANPSCSYKSS